MWQNERLRCRIVNWTSMTVPFHAWCQEPSYPYRTSRLRACLTYICIDHCLLKSPPDREPHCANLSGILKQLKEERAQVERQLSGLDAAIRTFANVYNPQLHQRRGLAQTKTARTRSESRDDRRSLPRSLFATTLRSGYGEVDFAAARWSTRRSR